VDDVLLEGNLDDFIDAMLAKEQEAGASRSSTNPTSGAKKKPKT